MNDLISIQTVKEQMLKYGFSAPDMTVTEFTEDLLPSAQPEPLVKESRTLVKDLVKDAISRQAAIVQLSHNKTGNDDCDVVIQNDIETIKALPSEEVSADIIHLQKEQAYMQGYEDGRKSLKGER